MLPRLIHRFIFNIAIRKVKQLRIDTESWMQDSTLKFLLLRNLIFELLLTLGISWLGQRGAVQRMICSRRLSHAWCAS